MMNQKFNEVRIIGTDGASLFFYHPDDLVHRPQDPSDWMFDHLAIQKEFKAGNLIALNTDVMEAFQFALLIRN